MRSKPWSRRFGFILNLSGLFISGLTAAVSYCTVPLLLQPGIEIDGTSFSGGAAQALMVLGVFALVRSFGVTTLFYGLWQMKTDRRNMRVEHFLMRTVSR